MIKQWTILNAVCLGCTVSASGGILWDNGIVPNGEQGRAVSPPNFPDIRVVDDFTVPEGERWTLE